MLGEDAKLLAGGQSLIPMLALRLARTWWTSTACRAPLGGRAEDRHYVDFS
jgi:hypothetical protein